MLDGENVTECFAKLPVKMPEVFCAERFYGMCTAQLQEGAAEMYGVSTEHWKSIYRILESCQEYLYWVKLFGSRARGDYRKTSDVDLAIAGTEEAQSILAQAFIECGLPYTFDLVDYERQSNENLRRVIDREGKLLLLVEKGGGRVMTKEQIRLKWEDYHKALQRLQTALGKMLDADDLYLDAAIQRFEFCFELAWKLMKAVLAYEGIEVNSPRGSIREGWQQGLIGDAEEWLDMLEKRNLSAHTYNEKTAREIYRGIKERYAELLLALDKYMQDWQEQGE